MPNRFRLGLLYLVALWAIPLPLPAQTPEALPKQLRLVIEGSDQSAPTFIVMEYQEGFGVRYLECSKTAGSNPPQCETLNEVPLTTQQVEEIRKQARQGSLFERYAEKERSIGCAALVAGSTGLLGQFVIDTIQNLTPRTPCLLALRRVGGVTIAEPVSAATVRPPLKEAMRDAIDRAKERKGFTSGFATAMLLGAALCAHGKYGVEQHSHRQGDADWIFAPDSEGTYQAGKLTTAQIRELIRNAAPDKE